MARYLVGSPLRAGRLGLLPAAFNPPTVAHLALADAAADFAGLDQVAFVLPEKLPHKRFEGASFEQRVALLKAAVADTHGRAVAVAAGGLFIEIAREFRALCGPAIEIFLVCGSDAADRIVNWDYAEGPTFAEQLEEFRMLVGSRGRRYQPPYDLQDRIKSLELPPTYATISSTAARGGGSVDIPPRVAELVARWGLYRGR